MAQARQASTWKSAARKSPLRVVGEVPAVSAGLGQPTELRRVPPDSPVAVRRMMISEFCDWLRSRTNR
jgi:hypothetical protein